MGSDLFDIVSFRRFIRESVYNKPNHKCAHRILERLSTFIGDENITFIYPKGMLAIDEFDTAINNPDMVCIVVITTSSQIIIAKALDGGKTLETIIKKKSDISNINIKCELSDYTDAKNVAKVTFYDGYTIEFDYAKDGNPYWESDYSKAIIEMVRILKEQ